jgi:citrate lyase beta subunit
MINIFQFTKPDVSRFAKFSASALRIGANVVVDIEDSVQIPHKPTFTPRFKEQTREQIAAIAMSGIEDLSIRINAPASEEFVHDVAMMKCLHEYTWRYVFVPKCESAKDILEVAAVFEEAKIKTSSWIPIIETQIGVENVSHVLRALPPRLAEYIGFGYSDFNYDAGYFPFYHENSAQYWRWVDEITRTIREAKYQYLHSPFLRLHDSDGFEKFLQQVLARCPQGFAQTTLSPEQSSVCAAFENTSSFFPQSTIVGDGGYTHNERIAIAEAIVSARECNANEGSLITHGERLISPHEYFAAKRFLLHETSSMYGFNGNI